MKSWRSVAVHFRRCQKKRLTAEDVPFETDRGRGRAGTALSRRRRTRSSAAVRRLAPGREGWQEGRKGRAHAHCDAAIAHQLSINDPPNPQPLPNKDPPSLFVPCPNRGPPRTPQKRSKQKSTPLFKEIEGKWQKEVDYSNRSPLLRAQKGVPPMVQGGPLLRGGLRLQVRN